MKLSKSQIDKIGERLRNAYLLKEDLIAIDEYRRSFGDAFELAVNTIRRELKLEPSGRPAKSTKSIIEKLLRESVRFSQIQDIAGCRLVVENIEKQEQVVASLCTLIKRKERS